MDKTKLIAWLTTIDPQYHWNIDNLEMLEKQIVDIVKVSGFINVKMLVEA